MSYITVNYGEHIMRLLKECEISKPNSPVSTVDYLNSRTLALTKLLVIRPPPIISSEEWIQRQLPQDQPTQQQGEASSHPPTIQKINYSSTRQNYDASLHMSQFPLYSVTNKFFNHI